VRENDTPGAEAAPPPHPFASELADVLRGAAAPRVLLLGFGNGRNLPPFTRAGIRVDTVEEDAARARYAAERTAAQPLVRVARCRFVGPYPYAGGFDGALSTSAFLHGSPATVDAALAAVAARLRPNAPFYATFGSTRDPRFGRGVRIDAATYAAADGPESGVPHAFFDEARLRERLGAFVDLDLREGSAAETAGRWAHAPDDAAEIRHWFVRARRA
jgi:SAM-dependent methyltransferase